MENLYKITALKKQYNNVKVGDYFICDHSLPFGMQIKKVLIAEGRFTGMPLSINYDITRDKDQKEVNGWLVERM